MNVNSKGTLCIIENKKAVHLISDEQLFFVAILLYVC